MNHRKIREIIHEICDCFYTKIKDETDFDNVNKISQEYYKEYENIPLALDLIRALVSEWCRENLKGETHDGQKQ